MIGLVSFAATSLLCAVAPDTGSLIAARCVQGVAAALLVPNSLAIVSASFATEDRGARDRRVVGARRASPPRSARSSAGTSSTRCRGGGCSSSTCRSRLRRRRSSMRHVPESRDEHAGAHLDVAGSALLTVGLAGLVYALIEGPGQDWPVGRGRVRGRRSARPSRGSSWSRRGSRTRWCRSASSARSSSRARTRSRSRCTPRSAPSPSCWSCTCRPTSATPRSKRARRCSRSPRACCCSRRVPARSRSASGPAGR